MTVWTWRTPDQVMRDALVSAAQVELGLTREDAEALPSDWLRERVREEREKRR